MNPDPVSTSGSAYSAAGVDIDAANRTVAMMAEAVRSTRTPAVLSDVGAFGGLFSLAGLPADAVLAASTDGVGTKVELAARLQRWDGIGRDLVNHCVDDILVQNARPLFFLDYVASSKLVPEAVAGIVIGMAAACREVGCALLGGETAEMPGVYEPGAVDVAGTIVGVVGRADIWPRSDEMAAGDVIVGLPSSGPHTNGYSLIRRIVADRDLDERLADGRTLADALLEPHRSYLAAVDAIEASGARIKALAHITGGGFTDNVPRVVPAGLGARIDTSAWPVPELFARLVEWGSVTPAEAYRVFNMGMGMCVMVSAADSGAVLGAVEGAAVIGELTAGGSGVELV